MFKIKEVEFLGRKVSIVTHGPSGPCPLTALVNVLLLRNSVQVRGKAAISSSEVMSLLAARLFDSDVMKAQDTSKRHGVTDAVTHLPKFATSLDVNLRFTHAHDFGLMQEIAVFDMLDVSLVHGWVVDPTSPEAASIGALSLSELRQHLAALDAAEDGNSKLSAADIKGFLERTVKAQVTPYGVKCLTEEVPDRQICVLYKGGRFYTAFRREDKFFLLCNDPTLLDDATVVWEQLMPTGGTIFCNAAFNTHGGVRDAAPAPPLASLPPPPKEEPPAPAAAPAPGPATAPPPASPKAAGAAPAPASKAAVPAVGAVAAPAPTPAPAPAPVPAAPSAPVGPRPAIPAAPAAAGAAAAVAAAGTSSGYGKMSDEQVKMLQACVYASPPILKNSLHDRTLRGRPATPAGSTDAPVPMPVSPQSKLLPGTVPMTMDPATERDHYLALKLQEQDEERERAARKAVRVAASRLQQQNEKGAASEDNAEVRALINKVEQHMENVCTIQ